jgi:polar amino acid transport system substrate-binding protein
MKTKLIAFSIFIMSFTIKAETQKIITIKSDPWCPFACETKNNEKLGIVVDIAKAVFAKNGYTVKYDVMNYARAIIDTRNGLVDAVAGCAKEDAPDFIFPTKPVTTTNYVYFSKAESNLKVSDLKSIEKHKVGSITGYSYDETSTKAIASKNKSFFEVSGENGLEQLIKMLETNRIDSLIESEEVFWNYLQEKNIDSKKFKAIGKMKQTPQQISLCFSPKNPKSKEFAAMLVKGMDEMKKSGELVKLFNKYNMKLK